MGSPLLGIIAETMMQCLVAVTISHIQVKICLSCYLDGTFIVIKRSN